MLKELDLGDARLKYFICSNQRSGSEYLCELLRAARRLGRPGEHFLIYNEKKSFLNFCEFELKMRTKVKDGVFGVKIHGSMFQNFIKLIRTRLENEDALKDVDILKKLFGRPYFIWLRRRNKVSQAISFIKARHTGLWQPSDFSKNKSLENLSSLKYDYQHIEEIISEMNFHDSLWQNFFKSSGIYPLTIVYEDLVIRPKFYINKVCKYLELETFNEQELEEIILRQSAAKNANIKKISNSHSREWEERFLADFRSKNPPIF